MDRTCQKSNTLSSHFKEFLFNGGGTKATMGGAGGKLHFKTAIAELVEVHGGGGGGGSGHDL